jgi:hypothetical protein
MKRSVLVCILAFSIMLPIEAQKADTPVWRGTLYPEFGTVFYPGAAGISVGFQSLIDFDRLKNPFTSYLGARFFLSSASASTYVDEDFYGTLSAGLRYAPLKKPATGRSPLAFRLGMDLGGGYTNREPTAGSATGYPSWMWEPNGKIEFTFSSLGLCISGGYRSIISPKNGWSFSKGGGFVTLGFFGIQ